MLGVFCSDVEFFNFDDRNPSRLAWVGVFSGWAAFSYALLNMAISPFVVMGVNGWVKWFCLFVGVMGNVGWVAWVWKAYAQVCRQAKISGDLCSDWSSHMLVRHDFANKIFDKADVNIHMPAILIVPFAPLFLLGFMVSPILNQAVGEAGTWIVVALLMIPSSVYFNGMFVRVVMMHLYLPICLGRNYGVKVFSMPVVF
ncbi:hypothetical protein [Burkholderia lata]|uniref:hypothetical protein n=1 Tax=Burkholderia lata (strain ATCC 17760 / DSM 23089 / LMG 22485 / NCIMB 9086 / R18194 / 383) TaxID=482957 RepID=UPI00158185BA|nr:hypothetical protein [Burkholderia lata]